MADPSEEQRALLRGYLGYGVARVSELAIYGEDSDAHVDFLLEFAPEQSCTAKILDRTRRSRWLLIVVLIVALVGLGVAGVVQALISGRRRAPRCRAAHAWRGVLGFEAQRAE